MVDIGTVTDPAEIIKLETWELQEVGQQCLAQMAVAQAHMARLSDHRKEYDKYADQFKHYKQMSSVTQTLLRVAATLAS